MTPDTFDDLPTKETSQKVYDNLDLMRGVEVFLNFISAASLLDDAARSYRPLTEIMRVSRSCDLRFSSGYHAKPKEGLRVHVCFRPGRR